MALKQTKNIWFNDKLVPWEDATIHVLTYALHYGSAVFEGIRAYKTGDGCKIFRLDEHIKRLLNSAKIYRMNIPYSHQELKNACRIIVSSNDLNEGAYIRPIAFRGYDDLGLHAHNNDACVSSWNKINPNTVPFMAKASGNYLSGTLVAMEARQNGYDEGILLDSKGMVSEGAGENIFMVKDGNLYTPPLSSSVLDGITRDAVIKIAGSLKLGVIETEIPREQLYIADELFFTGTAVEITPIKSVDKITIGTGTKGPVTAQIQKVFFGLFDGSTEDSWGWLEPVE